MSTVVMPYRLLEAHTMAVDRVEQLLRLVTSTLNEARVPYAVIGGNAVAAWVSSRDPDAVRTTKDVDLLANRADLPAMDAAMRKIGYYLDFVGHIPVLLEQANPSPRRGVHLLYAGEKVRPTDSVATPHIQQSSLFPQGFHVVSLAGLLTMKLIAFRKHDQVHIEDMFRVGLITPEVRAEIPTDLLPRLEEIERTLPEWH